MCRWRNEKRPNEGVRNLFRRHLQLAGKNPKMKSEQRQPNNRAENVQKTALAAFQFEQFSVSLSEYDIGIKQNWHSHEEPILALILAGHTREQVGSQDIVASPLDIGLKPANLSHTDHFCPNGVRVVRVALAASIFKELGREAQTLERWDWIKGSNAVRPLLQAADKLRRGDSCNTEIKEDVYESIASLLPAKQKCPVAATPAWLYQAREHLQESYASGVRLSELAEQAGVHPVYFARQFRRFYGVSVGEYVRHLQFREAATLLANQKNSLAQIAYKVGCADQAHLTRLFAAGFGITPARFRRIVT
jgi:AraC family transcriptional regulator